MTNIEKVVASIDPVVFSIHKEKLHVLLLKRYKKPFVGTMALPGGVVIPSLDDSIENSINRVLSEKTGVKVRYIEQVQTVGSKVIDPRSWTISISYLALVEYQQVTVEHAQWVAIDELKNYDFGFEHHKKIISTALERLTNKVNYSTLPVDLMNDEFTLPDLQKIYESILGERMDKSSFRKKILETGVIEDTGEKIKQGAYRPSVIYRKIKKEIVLFNKNIF